MFAIPRFLKIDTNFKEMRHVVIKRVNYFLLSIKSNILPTSVLPLALYL